MLDQLSSHLPTKAKSYIAPAFWRYQSWMADRSHTPPDLDCQLESPPSAHVIIVVIDALRPDHVPTLPIQFSSAIAPSTWTFPSVTSMHTGLRPSEHGSVAHTAQDDDSFAMPDQTDEPPLLPLSFEAAGYDTYVGCGFATPFTAVKGWYQTHRVYDDVRAKRVLEDYNNWRKGHNRTFAYLHLGDLHAPIDPPDPYISSRGVDTTLPDIRYIKRYATDFDPTDPECRHYREQKFALYRSALDYIEDQLTGFIHKYSDDSSILIVGDHGEAFWEHHQRDKRFTDSRPNYSLGHGGTPFDVVSRVPVGTHVPGRGPVLPHGGRGSLRDLPATLIDLFIDGTTPSGISWLSSIPNHRIAVSEGVRYGVERKAAYRGNEKLIHSPSDGVTMGSRIRSGNEQFESLSEQSMEEMLDALPDSWEDGVVNLETSEFVEEQLEYLGYK